MRKHPLQASVLSNAEWVEFYQNNPDQLIAFLDFVSEETGKEQARIADLERQNAQLFTLARMVYQHLDRIGMGKANDELPEPWQTIDQYLASDLDSELFERLSDESEASG